MVRIDRLQSSLHLTGMDCTGCRVSLLLVAQMAGQSASDSAHARVVGARTVCRCRTAHVVLGSR